MANFQKTEVTPPSLVNVYNMEYWYKGREGTRVLQSQKSQQILSHRFTTLLPFDKEFSVDVKNGTVFGFKKKSNVKFIGITKVPKIRSFSTFFVLRTLTNHRILYQNFTDIVPLDWKFHTDVKNGVAFVI